MDGEASRGAVGAKREGDRSGIGEMKAGGVMA